LLCEEEVGTVGQAWWGSLGPCLMRRSRPLGTCRAVEQSSGAQSHLYLAVGFPELSHYSAAYRATTWVGVYLLVLNLFMWGSRFLRCFRVWGAELWHLESLCVERSGTLTHRVQRSGIVVL
jgi:hypothetical protein